MSEAQSSIRPADGFDYYQGDVYWNNFSAMVERFNRLISGRPDQGWEGHTRERYGVAERALFVHCGNGWVERDCFRVGLIKSVVGTDISNELLKQARREAEAISLPCAYHYADTNTFDFGTLNYDWVFNHAAFHHIAYIDAALRSIWRGLPNDGLLVSYDYTGPHRNQYPWEIWSAMMALNRSLPEKYRADLRYPHLKTMLATDPTEAVHSELILETCSRYFDIVEIIPLGGALAYQIMYNNKRLHAEQATPEGAETVGRIIAADQDYTAGRSERSFFNYWVAKPKPASAVDPTDMERWTREEVARETAAAGNGQRYGGVQALEEIYDRYYDLLGEVEQLRRK